MLILPGLMLLVFGYSHIYHKDFWWWDTVLLFNALNRPIERTLRWERQQEQFGLLCMLGGLFLLVYAAGGGVI